MNDVFFRFSTLKSGYLLRFEDFDPGEGLSILNPKSHLVDLISLLWYQTNQQDFQINPKVDSSYILNWRAYPCRPVLYVYYWMICVL